MRLRCRTVGACCAGGNDLAYRTAFGSQDGGANVAAIVDLRSTCNDAALSDEAKRQVALAGAAFEAKDSSIMDCPVDVHSTSGANGGWWHGACSSMSAGFMPSYQLACQPVLSSASTTVRLSSSLQSTRACISLAASTASFSLDLVETDVAGTRHDGIGEFGGCLVQRTCLLKTSTPSGSSHPWPFLGFPKVENLSISTKTCRSKTLSVQRAWVIATSSW